MRKVTFIDHSKILSAPIIGSFFYEFQSNLYEKNILYQLKFARRKNRLKENLLKDISKNSGCVICRTLKFGRLLGKIEAPVILDISEKIDFSDLPRGEQHSLMWSLVFASFVTKRTKNTLRDFLPKDFPVKKTVVIPYNDSFEVVCDYIFQTAKALVNKGNIVYLVALEDPISLLKSFIDRRHINKRVNFFEKNNIHVVRPLTLFPLRFMRYKFFERINKRIALLYTSLFVRRIMADYLWCFDPADADLVRLVDKDVTSIYDCVDYFSTLDTKLDEEIKVKETELIKAVDFFFVNSHTLEKEKRKIRKPVAVVPQGFDTEAFTMKDPLTNRERKEVSEIRKIFRKVPRPRVGFVGSLTYRIDYNLLLSLVNNMPNVSFVLTDAFIPMPHDDRFANTEKFIKKIRSAENVYFVPETFSRRVVKEILRQFDIGMIPYDVSFDFNRYCYPMKLFEYFYMGKPIVSTPIEELKNLSNIIKLAQSSRDWEERINELIEEPWLEQTRIKQRELAEQNSWKRKVDSILSYVEADRST